MLWPMVLWCHLTCCYSCYPASYSDQPVFTLKQVVATCQHMIKEREEQIREDYDKVLNDKMQGIVCVCARACVQCGAKSFYPFYACKFLSRYLYECKHALAIQPRLGLPNLYFTLVLFYIFLHLIAFVHGKSLLFLLHTIKNYKKNVLLVPAILGMVMNNGLFTFYQSPGVLF